MLLQRKDKKKGWVTVKSGSPAATIAWTLKPPKGKSLWRVLLPGRRRLRESVSAEVKVKRQEARQISPVVSLSRHVSDNVAS